MDLNILAHMDFEKTFDTEAEVNGEFDKDILAQTACTNVIQNCLMIVNNEEKEKFDKMARTSIILSRMKKFFTLFSTVDPQFLNEETDFDLDFSIAFGNVGEDFVIGVRPNDETQTQIPTELILYGIACFLSEFLEDAEFDSLLAIANVNITMNILDENKENNQAEA